MFKPAIPKSVYLYDEGVKGIDFKKIEDFITKNFGKIPVHIARLRHKAVQTHGLILNLAGTERAFRGLEFSRRKESCHIILTTKLFATPDEFCRPHIRASSYGSPSIISLSGIVEGPAKPREYYQYKQKYSRLGVWQIEEPEIRNKFKGRFIDYGDKRLTGVVNGYIAQALFYFITGKPFCLRKACRLYNSHWQKDLIFSQIKKARFCAFHKSLLKRLP